jgi:crossover junction endodeoxyribonuclease RusA
VPSESDDVKGTERMQTQVTVDQLRKLSKSQRAAKRAARRREEDAAKAARRERFRLATEPVTVRLPFPPSLNHYYRTSAIVPKVGRPFASTRISDDGEAYRKTIIDLWREDVGVTFKGRLAIKVVAVFPDNRERDLDGLWKALLDSLSALGFAGTCRGIREGFADQGREHGARGDGGTGVGRHYAGAETGGAARDVV